MGKKEKFGENTEPLMEFETFKQKIGSFALFFGNDVFGDMYRKKDIYKDFANKYPGLESKVREEMQTFYHYLKNHEDIPKDSPYQQISNTSDVSWRDFSRMDLPLWEHLYEAYKQMKELGCTNYQITQ
ncbi:MAG: hypothetical protein WC858_06025 [Parcubacteria group bacterium]|jgi:hypothetical protein